MPDTPIPPLTYLSAADVEAAMPPIEERLGSRERPLSRSSPTQICHRRSPSIPAPTARSPMPCRPTFAARTPKAATTSSASNGSSGSGGTGRSGCPRSTRRSFSTMPDWIADRDHRWRADHRATDRGGLRGGDPAVGAGRSRPSHHVAIIGAGVQGHSHVEVVGHVLAGCSLVVFDQSPDAATRLARRPRRPAASTTSPWPPTPEARRAMPTSSSPLPRSGLCVRS